MTHKHLWILFAAVPYLFSCTLIVDSSVNGSKPSCSKASDCLAGYVCSKSVCVKADAASSTGQPDTIGAEGGTVLGPEGVVLVIPTGAMPYAAQVEIRRLSATTATPGVVRASSLFALLPPGLELQSAAQLSLPAPTTLCDSAAGCAVYSAPGATSSFSALGTTFVDSGATTTATASITDFVLFTVGHAAVTDAGVAEDASSPDSLMEDVGSDLGSLPDLLAFDLPAEDALVPDVAVEDGYRPSVDSSAPEDGAPEDAPLPEGPIACTPESGCPGNKLCQVASGLCVECLGDTDCGDGADCEDGVCVAICLTHQACDPDQRCDDLSQRCVDNTCSGPIDCSFDPRWSCDIDSNLCVDISCDEDRDCNQAAGERCDVLEEICVVAPDAG